MAKRLEGPHELARLDLLVRPMGEPSCPRAEVDGVEACFGELSDRRPGLLRLDGETAGLAEPGHEWPVDNDVGRRRIAEDLELCIARQLPEPGLGRLTVDAVLARDYPTVQAIILLFSVTYVLINLLVDLTYTFLDPRIRY